MTKKMYIEVGGRYSKVYVYQRGDEIFEEFNQMIDQTSIQDIIMLQNRSSLT